METKIEKCQNVLAPSKQKNEEVIQNSMTEILNGNLQAVPLFVASLFDFFSESLHSKTKSEFVGDLSQKTMFVLSMLYKQEEKQGKKETQTFVENKQVKPRIEEVTIENKIQFVCLGYCLSLEFFRGFALGVLLEPFCPSALITNRNFGFFFFASFCFPSNVSFFFLSFLASLLILKDASSVKVSLATMFAFYFL